ncbi:TlpA disulfide reductase family protein [Aliiglaciecola sp. LCG003]|uniref:TlpA disulfide reductase family protein n=1 Tax=Aliiglaciecola sp. LCG003 TaxID=3053655 RepID=UPI0025730894|nr:TlpA disulfide reductase family protein [Aliiglaciecola sp. LCG003]WJG07848.1 TlpA disulfide reductase family protein [Aliiglaciecola sp. LCG003]
MRISKSRLLLFARDLIIIVAIFYAIGQWQSRHLLDDDGSINIANQTLLSIDGNAQSLFKYNKRTLVYFFAPWCKICELSIPNLNQLSDPELEVVLVALDYQSQQQVTQFIQGNQVKQRVLLGIMA